MAKRGPRGPSKYEDEFATLLDKLGHEGEGVYEICEQLGIHKSTFYEWAETHNKFSDAVKSYRQRYQAWWEKLGRAGTVGRISGFNATSYIWNMKNRFPADWREKQEITGENGGPIRLAQEVPDDVRQALDAIATKLSSGTS